MTPPENENDEDDLLERAFPTEAVPLSQSDTEASWSRFRQYTFPEKQGWVAFHITRQQADARLKTMTRWTRRNPR